MKRTASSESATSRPASKQSGSGQSGSDQSNAVQSARGVPGPRVPAQSEVRSVDRELLAALRGGESAGIGQLTQVLEVTATAVRQRIDRLLALGLIDRQKIVAGRGRPTYRYRLTLAGHQRAGADPADLADAMWREIVMIPDTDVRRQLLSAIAARLGRQCAPRAGDGNERESFETRMNQLSEMLAARDMVTEVSHAGNLPVLDLGACPYPSLIDASDEREMCRLEEQMISEALGQPVELSSCRLDGDTCCQFSAVATNE